MIMQDDGTEVEETVNEATNILRYMKRNPSKQGIRINMTKKQQLTREFNDEETGLPVIFLKIPMGGSCIASGGKCIIIATFSELKQHKSAECNDTVVQMARYFAKSNWPTGDASSANNPATWKAYIDKLMVGKGNIAQALICAKDSGKLLANTTDFEV